MPSSENEIYRVNSLFYSAIMLIIVYHTAAGDIPSDDRDQRAADRNRLFQTLQITP